MTAAWPCYCSRSAPTLPHPSDHQGTLIVFSCDIDGQIRVQLLTLLEVRRCLKCLMCTGPTPTEALQVPVHRQLFFFQWNKDDGGVCFYTNKTLDQEFLTTDAVLAKAQNCQNCILYQLLQSLLWLLIHVSITGLQIWVKCEFTECGKGQGVKCEFYSTEVPCGKWVKCMFVRKIVAKIYYSSA